MTAVITIINYFVHGVGNRTAFVVGCGKLLLEVRAVLIALNLDKDTELQ